MLDEIQCRSAEELLERLAPRSISSLTGDKKWIYRGQGETTWQLVPAAFRPDTRFPSKFGSLTVDEFLRRTAPVATLLRKLAPSIPESYPFEAAQKGLEAETLTRFFNGVDAAGLSLPEDSQLLRERLMPDYGGLLEGIDDSPTWLAKWPSLELRSILALAQHHGLPTRLLDWTQDCRVAAFFAARDSFKRSTQGMAVWALDWQQLKVANLSASLRERAKETDRRRYRVRLVTAPAASNVNLRAQRGLFTLLETRSGGETDLSALAKDMAQERRPLDELEGIDIKKFALPSAEAGSLLRLLALDGVTAAAVWPGYDGVVQSLKDASEGLG